MTANASPADAAGSSPELVPAQIPVLQIDGVGKREDMALSRS